MKSLRALCLAFGVLASFSAQAEMKKTIKIATEGAYAPWNFTGAGGKLEGFEIDLANDLCARMKVKCEIVAQDWDGIIPALQAKKYDAIMAGMNITDKRLEVINFSHALCRRPRMASASLKDSPLAKLPGAGTTVSFDKDPEGAKKAIEAWKPLLKGKTVGVQGSTVELAVPGEVPEGHDRDPRVQDHRAARPRPAAGRIDAHLRRPRRPEGARRRSRSSRTWSSPARACAAAFWAAASRCGMRKDDAELKKAFDAAIEAAIKDGTIKKLSEKWFKIDVTPQV